MADGQDSPGRRLRLSRETLRDLEPTAEEAASVKGAMAETSVCGGANTCQTVCACPTMEVVTRVIGSTHMTWGCKGQVVIDLRDEGLMQISYEMGPDEHTLRRAKLDRQAEE